MTLTFVASIFYDFVDAVTSITSKFSLTINELLSNVIGSTIDVGSFGDYTIFSLLFAQGIFIVIAIWVVRLFIGLFT